MRATIFVRAVPIQTPLVESKPPIYCVLLMWQYIYGRERNQDSKSYLDSKFSCKLRMNVRETSVPYKLK